MSGNVSPQDNNVSPQENPAKDPRRLDHRGRADDRPAEVVPADAGPGGGREDDLDGMSKADASRLIDELQAASGRGTPDASR